MRVVPSPWRRMRHPGPVGGVGFEVGEPVRLGLLGDLRGDDVEDPAAEAAELLGPELLGVRDQLRLRRATVVASTRAGRASRARRITCACASVTAALPHPRREHRPVAVQRGREGEVGAGVGEPGPGPVRQPSGGVLRPRRVGQVTGVGQDPQPQLGQLPLRRAPARPARPPSRRST